MRIQGTRCFPDGETRTRTGDTTISVVRSRVSNGFEIPGDMPIIAKPYEGSKVRKYRSFRLDSGDACRLISQWGKSSKERRRSAVLAGCLPPVAKDRPAGWIPQRETPCEPAVSRTSVLSQLA
jgi:hypothetical protein